MQMLIASRRSEASIRIGQAHCGTGALLDKFLNALPFELTDAQSKVIAEIRHHLAARHRMNRLLQGDVGSGKTVVAIAAMLLAIEAGYQAAFMAPTQILAEQHYAVLRRWLEPLGVRMALRTAARQEDNAPLPLFAGVQGSGSARVSRVGGGVAPSRTFLDVESPDDAFDSRRRLPHFEKPWAIYAVTIGTRSQRCLSPNARTTVLEALRHFHQKRYELFAACVMPDHVHFLIQPWPKENDDAGNVVFWPLNGLVHSIKSFSAHKINKIERKSGALWEKERFDRYVRSDRDLEEKFHYILRNPWDTGVVGQNEDYPWAWTQDDEARQESSFRRDAETSTRDACATQSEELAVIMTSLRLCSTRGRSRVWPARS
jgi:REP element-mobilizing transposase RayT